MRLGWTEHFGPRMQYKTKPIYGSYFFLESHRSFAHLFVKEKVRLLVTIDERKANRLSRWKRGNFLERTCTTHSVLMLVTSAARSWHSSWKTRLLLSRWTDQLRRITINQTLFAATSRSSSWLSLSLTVVQTSKNTPTLAIIFDPLVVVAYSQRSFCFFCAKLTKTLKLWEPFCKSICKTLHLADPLLLWISPLEWGCSAHNWISSCSWPFQITLQLRQAKEGNVCGSPAADFKPICRWTTLLQCKPKEELALKTCFSFIGICDTREVFAQWKKTLYVD